MVYESPDLTRFRRQAGLLLTQAAPLWRTYRQARQAMDATFAETVRAEPGERHARLDELFDHYVRTRAAARAWDQTAAELFPMEQDFRHADAGRTHLWNELDLAPELNLGHTDRHMDPFADGRQDGYLSPHLTGKVQGAIAWQLYGLGLAGPPRQEWSQRDAIGTHPFEPRGQSDESLAEAVLDRLHPVLRYAQDAGIWLIREPDRWVVRGDLTHWAVSAVFPFIPEGDPFAGKDSAAYKRAKLRERFGNTGSSHAIARCTEAIVSADPDADPDADPGDEPDVP